jgi:hypothetical protein
MSAFKPLLGGGAGACVVLALAGCGSNKKAATTAATSSLAAPTTTTTGTSPQPVKPNKVTSVTYRVNLAGAHGTPAGAPNGSGLAVIRVRSINPFIGELCWRFSALKNVTAPTGARIYPSPTGTTTGVGTTLGFPGRGFMSSGCLPEAPSFLALLEDHPRGFDISVDSAQFPRGAARGQI